MCTVSPKLSKVSRIKCQICRRHGKIVNNNKNIAVLRDATALDLSRLITVSLLSANEVCGKVIFLHLFVILFTGGMPGPTGGCLSPGGESVPRGVSAPGGSALGEGVPAPMGVPGGDLQTATAAGGMHPTGMHSCFTGVCLSTGEGSLSLVPCSFRGSLSRVSPWTETPLDRDPPLCGKEWEVSNLLECILV